MIVLGIESATELVGVAVADGEGLRSSVWATGRHRHGEALMPAITHALEQAEVTLTDIEVVAVDVGPGLFTGLRVGVVTAKALAQALGLGIIAVTSVDVLAHAAVDAGWNSEVAAVVDARRGEVFARRYQPRLWGSTAPAGLSANAPAQGPDANLLFEQSGLLALGPTTRYAPAELAAALGTRSGGASVDGAAVLSPESAAPRSGPVLAVGDGARRYAQDLARVPNVTVAGLLLASPPPAMVAVLAAQMIAAGVAMAAPEAIQPVYLRDADARINWVQRRGAPT